MANKPKHWPDDLPYLTAPQHGRDLTPAQLSALRTRPASLPALPASATPTPSPLVRIQQVTDAAHPAHGQRGLFAARRLAPGSFIAAYLGRVHAGAAAAAEGTDAHSSSDYDLWLDREAGLAVDAAAAGGEARFVNDFRGVRGRPNAVFGTAWCERWGQVCVGFWVASEAGKGRGKGGIRKGEEILVSYGKGFWDERTAEALALAQGQGEDEPREGHHHVDS